MRLFVEGVGGARKIVCATSLDELRDKCAAKGLCAADTAIVFEVKGYLIEDFKEFAADDEVRLVPAGGTNAPDAA